MRTPTRLSTTQCQFPALMMAMTVLLVSAVFHVLATPVMVSFTVWMPNSTYPSLGEYWQGQLTYDSQPNVNLPYLGFPSVNYPLLSISGTRTVWVSSAAAPTTYSVSSTATIIGLVPANKNQYWWNNVSIPLAPGVQREQVASMGPTAITNYGTLLTIQWQNLTNYTRPDGWELFPLVNIGYDNIFYLPSQVADCMDLSGWLVQIDRPQPGTLNVTGNVGFSQYTYSVNLYSSNNVPSQGGDLSDWDGDQEPGVDLIPFGFSGNITVQYAMSNSAGLSCGYCCVTVFIAPLLIALF